MWPLPASHRFRTDGVDGRAGGQRYRARVAASVCFFLLVLAAWAAPSAGAADSLYWSAGDSIRVGNLDGSGSPTTLFAGEGDAKFPAVLHTPGPPPSPASAAGEDPKCKKLRKKRKRQQANLAKAGTERKRSQIQTNLKDTKSRMKRLGCGQ